jgi:hypothetical protein
VFLLTGCAGGQKPRGDGEAQALEGSWEIVSVERDGENDAQQVGARLTFRGNAVTFQPKVVSFGDYTG